MKQDKISSTALTVIQGLLYQAQNAKYSHLVNPELKQSCIAILSSSTEGQKRLKQLRSKWFRRTVPVIEKLMMPGITLHYVLRKRYLEDQIHQAISEGYTQILNIGAGFDTLASRLSKQYPDVRFIEIDHPETFEKKQSALVQSDLMQENMHACPANLQQKNIQDILHDADIIQAEAPTVCMLEGVLMYVEEKAVQHLFTHLMDYFDSGCRIIYTAAEPAETDNKAYGWLLKLYLSIVGEPLKWTLRKEQNKHFLSALNLVEKSLADSNTFKEKYLAENDKNASNAGEFIVIAEKE